MSSSEQTLQIVCPGCGGTLHYEPGTTNLHCEFCGNSVAITNDLSLCTIQEFDLDAFTKNASENFDMHAISAITCHGCNATVSMQAGMATDFCPFCNSSLTNDLVQNKSAVKPHYILPFALSEKTALNSFESWIKKRWFAPNDLKKYASANKLKGVYLPYWTFDSKANTTYTGERGEDYYTTESYSVTINGQRQTRTRQVKHTRWFNVSGSVDNTFDDVLVTATRSIPQKTLDTLEPWNLVQLMPYNDAYIAGFRSEHYTIGLSESVAIAKGTMEAFIQQTIKRDIGGDHQRISSMNVAWREWTFKHILLPVWVSAYRYHKKIFQFVVNAQTGEVQGERPWSWIKISLAALAALTIVASIFYWYQG
jgi:LSD1 subclass zinc finger protein